jgi:hypothetical protein
MELICIYLDIGDILIKFAKVDLLFKPVNPNIVSPQLRTRCLALDGLWLTIRRFQLASDVPPLGG